MQGTCDAVLEVDPAVNIQGFMLGAPAGLSLTEILGCKHQMIGGHTAGDTAFARAMLQLQPVNNRLARQTCL